ncbi:hypothetical protein Ccrd_001101 [Cynara cardunculus var. scolymus]|uniref:Lipase, GDSL n=1 Tax=Cynara cardunculus var. scolymus TaxID=59895 RepID=A0A118JXS6_CYNCS|nr:hypothetical protein Ccrd_001101 [Cynara cardunculus var. scolymus]
MARELFLVLIVLELIHLLTLVVDSEPQVPCYFLFGDSLVDSGNNNGFRTAAKANYPPYGIDFPQGVSGRFTNGRTYADIIGQFLGFPNFIPPYATVTTGVNYGSASASAGIREESGSHLTLYKLGARKIAVFGLAHIGCTPTVVTRFDTEGKPCIESVNDAVTRFNDGLKPLVDGLNRDNSEARFTFINFTSILELQGGAPLPNFPCCQVREDGQCIPNSIPCPIRASSIFFDGLHPMAIATRPYNALSPMDASPYDINHLAQL